LYKLSYDITAICANWTQQILHLMCFWRGFEEIHSCNLKLFRYV